MKLSEEEKISKFKEVAEKLEELNKELVEIGMISVIQDEGKVKVQMYGMDVLPKGNERYSKRHDFDYPLEKYVTFGNVMFLKLMSKEEVLQEFGLEKKMMAEIDMAMAGKVDNKAV